MKRLDFTLPKMQNFNIENILGVHWNTTQGIILSIQKTRKWVEKQLTSFEGEMSFNNTGLFARNPLLSQAPHPIELNLINGTTQFIQNDPHLHSYWRHKLTDFEKCRYNESDYKHINKFREYNFSAKLYKQLKYFYETGCNFEFLKSKHGETLLLWTRNRFKIARIDLQSLKKTHEVEI